MLVSTPVEAKSLKMATDHFPPWSILQEPYPADGINIVTMERIAKELGMSLEVVNCPFSRCLKMMETGKVDLMIGLFKTPERARYIHFLEDSFLPAEPKVFYQLAGKPDIESYSQLSDLHIGVVRDLSYSNMFDQDERLRKWQVTEDKQLITLLERGRIDAFIGGKSTFDFMLLEMNKAHLFEAASLRLRSPEYAYIGISKASSLMENVDDIRDVLLNFQNTGEFIKIESDWFLKQKDSSRD